MTKPAPAGGLKGIGDVADELGISHRTLRFYEDKGLIQPTRVSGTRVYSRRDVARMRLILRGKRLGFSIREISEFLELYGSDPEHAEQSERLIARARERMARLERQRDALDQTITELKAIEHEALDHLAAVRGNPPA